jgi:hypothetical protein
MTKNNLQRVILVGLGATSYGILATFVKSHTKKVTQLQVTSSQFILE